MTLTRLCVCDCEPTTIEKIRYDAEATAVRAAGLLRRCHGRLKTREQADLARATLARMQVQIKAVKWLIAHEHRQRDRDRRSRKSLRFMYRLSIRPILPLVAPLKAAIREFDRRRREEPEDPPLPSEERLVATWISWVRQKAESTDQTRIDRPALPEARS